MVKSHIEMVAGPRVHVLRDDGHYHNVAIYFPHELRSLILCPITHIIREILRPRRVDQSLAGFVQLWYRWKQISTVFPNFSTISHSEAQVEKPSAFA
jgi:hypothetical protein